LVAALADLKFSVYDSSLYITFLRNLRANDVNITDSNDEQSKYGGENTKVAVSSLQGPPIGPDSSADDTGRLNGLMPFCFTTLKALQTATIPYHYLNITTLRSMTCSNDFQKKFIEAHFQAMRGA